MTSKNQIALSMRDSRLFLRTIGQDFARLVRVEVSELQAMAAGDGEGKPATRVWSQFMDLP